MGNKFSSALSLGYATLFISLWLKFMSYAGWIANKNISDVTTVTLILGLILVICGIFSFFNVDKLDPVLFLIVAGYTLSLGLKSLMYPNLPATLDPPVADGWIHILIAVVIFYLWYGSLGDKVMRQLFLLGLWIAETVVAIGYWTGASILTLIAGYIGLIAAIFAGLYYFSTIERKKETLVS